jgi:hypothetical protein
LFLEGKAEPGDFTEMTETPGAELLLPISFTYVNGIGMVPFPYGNADLPPSQRSCGVTGLIGRLEIQKANLEIGDPGRECGGGK